MALTYLKLLLLLASLSGYILFLGKKGIEAAFAPVLTVSGISIIMFLAGLMNLMPQTAGLLLAVGLVLCLLVWKGGTPLDRHSGSVVGCLFLSVFLLSILYRNAVLSEPDDFSHWALVAKNLLVTDQLPHSGSILHYPNYPTGTAGFLYFACKVLGYSEPNLLRAQTILIISALCPLWAWVRRRYLFSGMCISLFTVFALASIGNVRCLIVDVPLSLLGAASFLALLYYRREQKKASLCSCLILSFLVLVKNSSFFFVFLHLVPALYFVRAAAREEGSSPSWGTWLKVIICNALLPLAAYLLWDWHVDRTFDSGNMARHSLSIPYLLQTFSEKSLSDIWTIFVRFVLRALRVGIEVPVFPAILAVLVLMVFLHWKKTREIRSPALWYLLWGLLAFGTWMASLLGMYLFSMPYAEALILGSWVRYVTTIALYLLCICYAHLLSGISRSESWSLPAAIAPAMTLCLLLTVRGTLPSLYRNIPFKTDARTALTQVRENYQIPAGSSYYIICDGWDVYVRFVGRYDFWSHGVFVESDPLNPMEPEALERCQHLILLREGEDVDQFLKNQGLPLGEQYYYLPDYR